MNHDISKGRAGCSNNENIVWNNCHFTTTERTITMGDDFIDFGHEQTIPNVGRSQRAMFYIFHLKLRILSNINRT